MTITELTVLGPRSVLESDAPGLRPGLIPAPGDQVMPGQVLARDRRRPWLALTSPCSGRVTAVHRGPRRSVARIEISPDEGYRDSASTDQATQGVEPTRHDLIEAGLWSAIRARPFCGIADPGQEPGAVLVTGYFSDPLGPDPTTVMGDGERAAFARGLRAVAGLAACGAVVIQAGIDPLGGVSASGLVRQPVPRGAFRNLGALVRRFGPGMRDRPVWHLDWQNVIDLGYRLAGYRGPARRVMTMRSAKGPLRLVRADVGASLAGIARAAGVDGYLVVGAPALLRDGPAVGRFDDRLSVLSGIPAPRQIRAAGPVIPLPVLEAELPRVAAPVLLLRALAAGDDETALRLGALDLGPEDVATCSRICHSGNDYPALLAAFLARQLEESRAA